MSRTARSEWKGPFLTKDLWKHLQPRNENSRKLITFGRASVILPFLLDRVVYLYNGKKCFPISITNLKIGYKLGAFIGTRKPTNHLSKDKKKKKKKK
uniref:Small ribosomal subunit protein uS19c n=1 Tax=Chromera velia TaxID=505693 RepID=D9IXJ2_9ALVE|nr:ribosomal protein S19 [Chromera velia]ADJ66520.1 ribosomal protein S19 [Chromera velia]AIE11688.1 ribosomal protein S19 [Chromera velia]